MKNVHIFDIDYDITEDDIPDGIDAVGNFISDETGFFHKGYHLSTDPE